MGRRRIEGEPTTVFGKNLRRAIVGRNLTATQVSAMTAALGHCVSSAALSRYMTTSTDPKEIRPDPHSSVKEILEFVLGQKLSTIEIEGDNEVFRDLDRFQKTELGKSLRLTDDDIEDARRHPWYDYNDRPTDDEWYRWFKLRREMRERHKAGASLVGRPPARK